MRSVGPMKGGVAESTTIQLHPVLCCACVHTHTPLLTSAVQDDAAEARSQFNLDRIVEVWRIEIIVK